MNRSQLKADTLYLFTDTQSYYYTPDGVGGYWYDNTEEVIEAGFGGYEITYRQSLTDW